MAFKTTMHADFHIIICPEKIEAMNPAVMEDLFVSWLLVPANVHVLDLQKAKDIDPQAIKPIGKFSRMLAINRKELLVLQPNPKLASALMQSGGPMRQIKNLDEARRKAS